MAPQINELILEFLAEIDDPAMVRQMSDEELGRMFREWLQRRHPDRYPALQLPLKKTLPCRSNPPAGRMPSRSGS